MPKGQHEQPAQTVTVTDLSMARPRLLLQRLGKDIRASFPSIPQDVADNLAVILNIQRRQEREIEKMCRADESSESPETIRRGLTIWEGPTRREKDFSLKYWVSKDANKLALTETARRNAGTVLRTLKSELRPKGNMYDTARTLIADLLGSTRIFHDGHETTIEIEKPGDRASLNISMEARTAEIDITTPPVTFDTKVIDAFSEQQQVEINQKFPYDTIERACMYELLDQLLEKTLAELIAHYRAQVEKTTKGHIINVPNLWKN